MVAPRCDHRNWMHTLDILVQPRSDPDVSLAQDAHFLHAVTRPSRTRLGVLRIYDHPGEFISLGRYHLRPRIHGTLKSSVRLQRRYSGGRAVPSGEGFVGIALYLPHRSALFSADPTALAPYQVLNRYVRGILEACRLARLAVFYPGRDLITVGRRILGMVSFEVQPSGAILFEAVLAVTRDFSILPHLLEAADPSGTIHAEMLRPEQTTCLEREWHGAPTVAEIADLIRRGYEKQFNLTLEPHVLSPLEEQMIHATAGNEYARERWLGQRQLRSTIDRHASSRIQLGSLTAHFSLEQERFIEDIVLEGDFIANSAAIESLEHELRLCPAEWRAIDAVVSAVLARPENYILGIGPARTITDTICKGLDP